MLAHFLILLPFLAIGPSNSSWSFLFCLFNFYIANISLWSMSVVVLHGYMAQWWTLGFYCNHRTISVCCADSVITHPSSPSQPSTLLSLQWVLFHTLTWNFISISFLSFSFLNYFAAEWNTLLGLIIFYNKSINGVREFFWAVCQMLLNI